MDFQTHSKVQPSAALFHCIRYKKTHSL
ncbi:hypothetical protein [Blautia pseudococcoides]